MGPPTVTHRIEHLEEKATAVEETVADLVDSRLGRAIETLHHSLAELVMESQVTTTKKLGVEMEAMAGQFEGRIARSREYQETLLNAIRSEQLKFQVEIKLTLTGLHLSQGLTADKATGSVNQAGSATPGMVPNLISNDEMMKGMGQGLLGSGLGGGSGTWRYKKLDMPIFEGTEDGWVLRMDRYFAFYKMTEVERMEAVVVAMEGDALRWFQWENKRRPIRVWAELKELVLQRFRSQSGGSLYEQWLATNQTTSVQEYQRRFIETTSPLEHISENILLGQFLNGLNEEIRVEVRLLGPVTLEQAMKFVIKVEDRNRATGARKFGSFLTKPGPLITTPRSQSLPSGVGGSGYSVRSWTSGGSDSQSTVQSPRSVASSVSTKNGGEVRRLSDRELQEKRAKGLYFRCDAKWNIGHRCKHRELSVLLLEEEEDTESEGGNSEAPTSPIEEIPTEVSLHSVIGLTNPKTMKLRGLIGHEEVVVLIDPGPTHNFLSIGVVRKLGIEVTQSGPFGVSLGNGESIRGMGVCKGVTDVLKI